LLPNRAMTVSRDIFEKIAALVGDKNTPVARASSRGEKLKLYGLYKRATVDSAERPERPGILKVDARLKWDAWAAMDNLTKEEARQAYVDLAKELIGKPVETVLAESQDTTQ
jgi:diazepam-binding inhibitor (GABA receptor modulating acyl-CoA-binding protein)